ncbi:biotin-dependent carboxyltransferase [Salinicola corii]|uniref:Biotin-dependent carboxyltransferase n=1 Tax=Salinicola corii TaxID=2606937 RepID=A0A640WDL4_9GAMM|nr:biotin-dependent carboxyltransferase family protein [Salinicola corii]KAA0017461.1 biotin-dependent carboxyltransferase [Salinicola corii]
MATPEISRAASGNAALVVEGTGPLALVEDAGRFGARHLGVTQGGALDWIALGWANWLLGNAPDAAGIEIAMGGLTLKATGRMAVAIAGADLGATRDGETLPANGSFVLEPGQVLAFDQPRAGLRAYLALPGGIDAEPFMGSLSTVAREQLGGLDGRGSALRVGDRLTAASVAAETREMPCAMAMPQDEATLELVTGAQIAHFDGASLYAAFNQAWQVDSRADRMGVRLTGPALHCRLEGMISEGIPLGAVQVPPDGQPIILLNDRQTIGGYPRLGALSPIACARLGQCAPGTSIRLSPVSPHQARRAYLRQLALWR